MEELELKLKTHLLNKKITDIEFYNINDSYFVFDPNSKWVFDGGFQLKLNDEVFTYAWEDETQSFNYSLDKTIETLMGEEDFYNIEAKDIEGIAALVGSEIEDVELKWEFYQEFDEEGELKDEKIYIPIELLLKFKSNNTLQLALVDFKVKKSPYEIVDAEYNLDGRLLISLNEKVEIKMSDGNNYLEEIMENGSI